MKTQFEATILRMEQTADEIERTFAELQTAHAAHKAAWAKRPLIIRILDKITGIEALHRARFGN